MFSNTSCINDMLTVRMFKPDRSRISQRHLLYTFRKILLFFICILPVSSLATRSEHFGSKILYILIKGNTIVSYMAIMKAYLNMHTYTYILSVYSPFSDRVGLPLHNIHIPSPFTSIMDIFFVNLKFDHIHFYTL